MVSDSILVDDDEVEDPDARLYDLAWRVISVSGPVAKALSASEWHELQSELAAWRKRTLPKSTSTLAPRFSPERLSRMRESWIPSVVRELVDDYSRLVHGQPRAGE